MPETTIPTEVELVFDLMPCQAERVAQEPIKEQHPCSYFRKWGTYHSFDYSEAGPPRPGTTVKNEYAGRAPLVPEMLSGCRKAPIMAVGINPNLPGWWKDMHGSLNPLFDDYRQYAHYFRHRRTAKPELSAQDYVAFGGGPGDEPPGSHLTLNVSANASGQPEIDVHWRDQKMYLAYQNLLDDLAGKMGWHANLQVGEDLSYANMVACPSAKWTTRPDPQDPRLPPMTEAIRDGIVTECFRTRKHFLRQLFQSLPSVILVFSQNTANAFIGELTGRFTSGNPQPGEPIASLMQKDVILHFGKSSNGASIDARIIFAPHPTGDPDAWAPARPVVVDQLVKCAHDGRLQVNSATGRLSRPAGSCVFCTMLDIGNCDYLNELKPLSLEAGPGIAAATPVDEKKIQTNLLKSFLADTRPQDDAWRLTDDTNQVIQ